MADVLIAGEPPGSQLSAQEEALWLLQGLVPDRGVSNVGVAVALPGRVYPAPLREALRWLVARHPPLRSRYTVVDGRPRRMVHPPAEVTIGVDRFTTTSDALAGDMRGYAGTAFDLVHGVPVRAGLYEVAGGSSVICLVAHHIVVDHASLGILLDELATAYRDAVAGRLPDAAPAAVPEAPPAPTAEALRYWREQIGAAEPGAMVLHGGRTPGQEPTFAGGYVWRRIPADLAERIGALRRRLRVTPNIVYLSAYYLLLLRHGAGPDLVTGVMLDARRGDRPGGGGSEGIGYRVDTVPLRVKADPMDSFADLARQVRDGVVAALAHPNVSYEMLRGEATGGGSEPGWWRYRMFRHVFNFRGRALAFAGDGPAAERMEVLHVDTGLARFDLELTVEADSAGPLCHLVHSTEVHDRQEAESLLDRYVAVLRAVVADPECPVSDLDLRTARDRALVSRANSTRRRWPSGSVPDLIRRQGVRAPDDPAIVDGGAVVSYARLLAAAAVNRGELVRSGVRPGDVVAVAGPRGARTAAALLGIWAAGAAYLPLDPSQPGARLEFELDDSGCRWIVDGADLPARCLAGRAQIAPADPTLAGASGDVASLPGCAGEDLAYVIYTSGSTGRPKGVRLTHANLHNVIQHFAELLDVGAGDATAWLTTLAFDISALELWLPLVRGGRVVVAADESRVLPEVLFDTVSRERVTILQATPTTWRTLAPYAGRRLAGLRVLCGGEPLPRPLARRLVAGGCRVFNVYGPTETTIWSTAAELPADTADVTVGRPISNTRVHILDGQREVPVGLPGEVCIAGDGVALGYLNRPEQTAASFPDHPSLGRIYRTGDIGRWRHDGRLELAGRLDRQVKLNGHRIELGEVESALEEHPAVRASAALLHRPAAGEAVLAAYVTPVRDPDPAADLAEVLWRHCADRLPRHAVPTRLRVVDALPLNGSGKIDYRRLELWDPDDGRPGAPAIGDTTDCQDPLVSRLTGLWREILGIGGLTADANFFLSGGHSVLAIHLLERASAICGTTLSLPVIFRAPTPAELARHIRSVRLMESEATR